MPNISYLKITASRRGGRVNVERYIKITEDSMLAVNVHTSTIKEVNQLYSTPYYIHPSTEEEFEQAHANVLSILNNI